MPFGGADVSFTAFMAPPTTGHRLHLTLLDTWLAAQVAQYHFPFGTSRMP